MQCKVSKVMTKKLNEEFESKNYEFQYVELTPPQYKWYVDTYIYDHFNDFNKDNTKVKAIMLSYPDDYYACNKYITTNDLIKCLSECETNDYKSFMKSVWRMIEI